MDKTSQNISPLDGVLASLTLEFLGYYFWINEILVCILNRRDICTYKRRFQSNSTPPKLKMMAGGWLLVVGVIMAGIGTLDKGGIGLRGVLGRRAKKAYLKVLSLHSFRCACHQYATCRS